jgi:hypothetical protein
MSSTTSRMAPIESVIEVAEPDVLAELIIKEYQLYTDRDFDLLTSRKDSARRDPVRDVVEKLTCAQLGELICTGRSSSDTAYEWFGMHQPDDNDNCYMVLKDWACYIITMCVYAQLKDTLLGS